MCTRYLFTYLNAVWGTLLEMLSAKERGTLGIACKFEDKWKSCLHVLECYVKVFLFYFANSPCFRLKSLKEPYTRLYVTCLLLLPKDFWSFRFEKEQICKAQTIKTLYFYSILLHILAYESNILAIIFTQGRNFLMF